MMKKIQINTGSFVQIDEEDYFKILPFSWHISKSGSHQYARSFIKMDGNQKKKQSVFLQHLIVGKAPKGKRLYFKDGNSLNCQKSNLEFITFGQAAHLHYKKQQKSKRAEENFKGVVVQYISRIKFNNKIIVLGTYNNEKDAARAYNLKATELFGEKAILNLV